MAAIRSFITLLADSAGVRDAEGFSRSVADPDGGVDRARARRDTTK